MLKVKSSGFVGDLRLFYDIILSHISQSRRNQIVFITIGLVLTSFLEFLGLGLIALLSNYSISGIKSVPTDGKIPFIDLNGFSIQTQVAILGCSATLILVTRTTITMVLTRYNLRVLAAITAEISTNLFKELTEKEYRFQKRKSTQEKLYLLNDGVRSLTFGQIGSSIAIITDLSILFVIGLGLFLVDPTLLFSSLGLLGVIVFFLQKKLGGKSVVLGNKYSEYSVESSTVARETFQQYPELFLRGTLESSVFKFKMARTNLSSVIAEMSFLPNQSKFLLESVILLSTLFVAAFQFYRTDSSSAVSSIILFLVAGMRTAPALIRLQQSLLLFSSSRGQSSETIQVMNELSKIDFRKKYLGAHNDEDLDFDPIVSLRNVSFKYPNSKIYILKNLNLDIEKNNLVAIVGPSGSGKSTLAKLILGLVEPSQGNCSVFGLDATITSLVRPGSMGYVPQDVTLINSTIRENLLLGLSERDYPDEVIFRILKKCQLFEYVSSLELGLNTQIGELGSSLSGGQKQRLGIARALISEPKFMFLDESTSALDGESEGAISKLLGDLKLQMTIVVIAHRLPSIRNSDIIHYLRDGSILKSGTFDELTASFPEFKKQLGHLGIQLNIEEVDL